MPSMPTASEVVSGVVARKTIQEELSELADITSFEDFRARYEAINRRAGRSELRIDLVVFVMDSAQVYLFENYSSIYSLLGSHSYPGYPHEKASIHGAIKRGEALAELTGLTYRTNMIEYLQELGPAAGRGLFSDDGQPLGFTLDDFALHKSKVPLLHKLVQSGKDSTEPNWQRFFEAGYLEYKQYVFSKFKGEAGGSFEQGDQGSPAHRPGGAVENAGEEELAELDPFARATTLQSSSDGAPELPPSKARPFKLPRLFEENLPSGTLPPVDWLPPRPHHARPDSTPAVSMLTQESLRTS